LESVSYRGTLPQIQFETDVAASENLCNVDTGAGCAAPPIGAKVYPAQSAVHWPLQDLGGHAP